MATAEHRDLFQARGAAEQASSAPLAARMRPRTLDEFVGQDHIVGPGRLLRRAIQADQLSSLIFYGPPGTGKTTLAQVIAGTTRARFIALNAVLAGVKQLREAIAAAREAGDLHGQRTILFIDEVHRWNKAQQDALLPSVENGTIVLIGATTENPYFEVIKPLVSRSRIFQLQGLGRDDLARVAQMALADTERGLGDYRTDVSEEAMAHLLNVANGDARSLLNALELAVATTPAGDDGVVRVDRLVAEESIQRRAVLYDKEGDAHYDTISAFIKSVRGSDPDAALYWMARMVYAGEDPRYLFRRMLILAAEDVGMADPAAIQMVTACAAAFDYVGLPEGRFHLAEAALYLSTAPKSNSTLGFFDALRAVEAEHEADIPAPLRDASRDAEGFGHGAGYQYPHAFTDHWVAQQYLPGELQGRVFYQPGDTGHERAIRDQVARRREANLAAAWEGTEYGGGEILTNAGTGGAARAGPLAGAGAVRRRRPAGRRTRPHRGRGRPAAPQRGARPGARQRPADLRVAAPLPGRRRMGAGAAGSERGARATDRPAGHPAAGAGGGAGADRPGGAVRRRGGPQRVAHGRRGSAGTRRRRRARRGGPAGPGRAPAGARAAPARGARP